MDLPDATTTAVTPSQHVRVPTDKWRKFGDVVGRRSRSRDVNAFIDWRIANPDATLTTTEPVWRALAARLAEQIRPHAYCTMHPVGLNEPGCHWCDDRAAYKAYEDLNSQ